MYDIFPLVKQIYHDIALFTQVNGRIRLRSYQLEAARAIIDSVVLGLGLTFVVVFPRQSGKNELQAQIEAYLLGLLHAADAEMVKVSPTWKPQTLNAMRRLERVLERNSLVNGHWQKESGYIYRIGQARIFFLSGSPSTNVVGATASTLLVCDEAQDVLPAKWDKDFAPMAASTNATRVFWGTMWTSSSLLARELRVARQAEREDGRRRAFVLAADEVAAEVPAYGRFVAEQVAKLGRSHPLVRTQFFSEEMDAAGGMFPEERRALMQGEHSGQLLAVSDRLYAMMLDVGGEDEGIGEKGIGEEEGLNNDRRDSTALTVVEVDLSTMGDELVRAPTYRAVQRYAWVGVKHTALYGRIKALAEHWRARYVVVDATGVGAGLASFLDKALPGRVIPFVFSPKSKSDLGWGFLSVIETGRYKEYQVSGVKCQERLKVEKLEEADAVAPDYERRDPSLRSAALRMTGGDEPSTFNVHPSTSLQTLFWRQVEGCQSEVVEGPGKMMRWGVPDGKRDPETGELLHDDLMVSAALCAVLDAQPWPDSGPALVVEGRDPLEEMDRFS